jgi:hypothetical protein
MNNIDPKIIESLVIVLSGEDVASGKVYTTSYWSQEQKEIVKSEIAYAKNHLLRVAESLLLKRVLDRLPTEKQMKVNAVDSEFRCFEHMASGSLTSLKDINGIDGLTKLEKNETILSDMQSQRGTDTNQAS